MYNILKPNDRSYTKINEKSEVSFRMCNKILWLRICTFFHLNCWHYFFKFWWSHSSIVDIGAPRIYYKCIWWSHLPKIVWYKWKQSPISSHFLPEDIKSLYIRCYQYVKSLCDVASLKKATYFRMCLVEECDQMKHQLCSSCYRLTIFQRLESIRVNRIFLWATLVGRQLEALSVLNSELFTISRNFQW